MRSAGPSADPDSRLARDKRGAYPVDTSTCNVGIRCVVRVKAADSERGPGNAAVD